jgi:NAD(P)-dependent dehydrogenase (short-subunit alcohol dehydrogenase family)
LPLAGGRRKIAVQSDQEEAMRLKDKVAVISGGAHGMGECEARLFAREGAAVVIADVIKEGEAVAADIAAGQGRARFIHCDVTSETDWKHVIAETIREFGRLDILVNNAGISGSAVGDHDALEGWQRLLSVNATGVFLGTKLAAAEMMKAGRGSIVNISSIMGFVASAEGHPGYVASKGAVRLYTKAAACRYGPHGVRVNSVHPGYLPPMLNATNQGMRDSKIALTPLRRLGEPIDVANGVLFLASDEASFITGTELVIDGGFLAQ